jgi:hypothetical protein
VTPLIQMNASIVAWSLLVYNQGRCPASALMQARSVKEDSMYPFDPSGAEATHADAGRSQCLLSEAS